MPLIFRSPVPVGSANARWPYVVVWLLLSVGIWCLLRGAGPHIELSVDLLSLQQDAAQLFYDRGQGYYSESESITRPVQVGPNHIEFVLPPGPIFSLRLDPVNSGSAASVSRIALRDGCNFRENVLPLDAWKPVAATVVNRSGGVIALDPGATPDPQLQFVPAEPVGAITSWAGHVTNCVSAMLLAFIVTLLLRKWFGATARIADIFIPVAMAAAGGLILAMALTSTTARSVHPDEFSHLGVYQYYENHWLPPAVDDPATIPSSSVWGYSYLFEWDVVYNIAAHLTAPLVALTHNDLVAARLFQIGLWLILCVLALCHRRWAWMLSVILLSPQIWYVFAYFNADAFALFLSLIAAGLVVDQGNGLHRFLVSGERRNLALWMAAACIGLLLVSKRNYLPVVPALLLWLAVLHLCLRARAIAAILGGLLMLGIATFLSVVPAMAALATVLAATGFLLIVVTTGFLFWNYWKDIQKRKVFMRLAGFVLICVAVALPRLVWDLHVNGLPAHKRAMIETAMETRAGPDFKPSVVAKGKGESTIALAARGVPLREVVFAPHHWAYTSLVSAFGVYGYMSVRAPMWMYVGLSALTLLFFLVALIDLRRGYPHQWLALTTIVLGCSTLVFASSLLLCWVDQFQAQGRYLLPAFALLALPLGLSRDRPSRRLMGVIILAAVALSLGSFAFIAFPPLAMP